MGTPGFARTVWLGLLGIGLSISVITAKRQARAAKERAETYGSALRASEHMILARTSQRGEVLLQNDVCLPGRGDTRLDGSSILTQF
jgi:hypothetical protein